MECGNRVVHGSSGLKGMSIADMKILLQQINLSTIGHRETLCDRIIRAINDGLLYTDSNGYIHRADNPSISLHKSSHSLPTHIPIQPSISLHESLNSLPTDIKPIYRSVGLTTNIANNNITNSKPIESINHKYKPIEAPIINLPDSKHNHLSLPSINPANLGYRPIAPPSITTSDSRYNHIAPPTIAPASIAVSNPRYKPIALPTLPGPAIYKTRSADNQQELLNKGGVSGTLNTIFKLSEQQPTQNSGSKKTLLQTLSPIKVTGTIPVIKKNTAAFNNLMDIPLKRHPMLEIGHRSYNVHMKPPPSYKIYGETSYENLIADIIKEGQGYSPNNDYLNYVDFVLQGMTKYDAFANSAPYNTCKNTAIYMKQGVAEVWPDKETLLNCLIPKLNQGYSIAINTILPNLPSMIWINPHTKIIDRYDPADIGLIDDQMIKILFYRLLPDYKYIGNQSESLQQCIQYVMNRNRTNFFAEDYAILHTLQRIKGYNFEDASQHLLKRQDHIMNDIHALMRVLIHNARIEKNLPIINTTFSTDINQVGL